MVNLFAKVIPVVCILFISLYATVLAEYGGVTRAGRQRYKKQIIEDLAAGLPIKDKIIGQSILGSNGFVEWVRESFLESQTDRERPAVGKIHRYASTEEVLALVSVETGIKDVIRSSGTTRQLVMTACTNMRDSTTARSATCWELIIQR